MAWPTPTSLREHFDELQNVMRLIDAFCTQRSANLAAGNVPAGTIKEIRYRCLEVYNVLVAKQSVPGLQQYARDQLQMPTLDIATEFLAVRSALQAVVADIESTFPKSGGYLLDEQWGATGTDERQFTPAQTATLRGLLDVVAASID